jgi:AcrR family transcriptional regulator
VPSADEEAQDPVATTREQQGREADAEPAAPPAAAPAPVPRGTLNEARWGEILDAAGAVFHEKGYQAARIEDIAARVGILKGSLYYYIQTKEDLLYALAVDSHEKGMATLEEDDATRAADAATRLRAFVRRYMAMIPATPDYAAVAERDVGLLSGERRERIMGMRTEIHRFLRGIVEQGIDEGCFDATLDPGVVTNSLLELLHGTVRWFRPGGRRSYADVAEFYVALLARGLGPDGPDARP